MSKVHGDVFGENENVFGDVFGEDEDENGGMDIIDVPVAELELVHLRCVKLSCVS